MNEIYVSLLGTASVKFNNNDIYFPYKKAGGLFYYLCVNKKCSRDELMGIFWADCSEQSARKNLRDALYKIKKTFDFNVLVSPIKSIIELNNECFFDIDIDKTTKKNIFDIYKGEFLEGFNIKNCYDFENWMLSTRDIYKSLYIKSVTNKLRDMISIRDIKRIETYGNILINDDPYNESTYRELMKIYALNGNYNNAIKLYYNLSELLEKELNVIPEEKTINIFKDILELKNSNNDSLNKSVYFYGRYNELYSINKTINDFIISSGNSFMILGEAGIGKTSLINKIVQTSDEKKLLKLKSNCYSAEEKFFLKPWQSIFMDISNFIKKEKINISTSCQKIIRQIFPDFLDENYSISYNEDEYLDDTKYHISEAILNVFTKITKKRKILLFFDDIQWMDEMSKIILSNILIHLAPNHVMFIGTYRDDFENKIHSFIIPLIKNEIITELRLKSFSYDETEKIATEYLKNVDLNESLFNKIYNDTEGNPLFLLELLKVINEKGYTKELSSKATNIIKSRLLTISPIERKILNSISIFFDNVNIEKLKFLVNIDELEIFEILESLQSKHLIDEIISENDIYYSFTHQKIREFVYNTQSVGKKKLLHKKISLFLEKKLSKNNNKFLYPNLIYHFEKSDNIVNAIKYKIKNLTEYYSISHETFPVDFSDSFNYKKEDDIFKVEKELLEIENQLNSMHNNCNEKDRLNMELSYLFGRYYIHFGEYPLGLENIDKSMNLAKILKNDNYLLCNYKQMIYYGIQVHNMATMKRYINKSLKIVESSNNIQEKGTLLRLKGLYNIKTKNHDEAIKLLYESIEIFKNLNMIQNKYSLSISASYNYLGQIYKYNDDYETAFNYYEKAINLCKEKGIDKGLDIFYTNAGQVLYETKKYSESQLYIEKALEIFDKFNDIWGRGMAEGYASLLAIRSNDIKKAKMHLLAAEKIANKFSNPRALKLVKRIKKKLD